jgi:transposase InsO family protein
MAVGCAILEWVDRFNNRRPPQSIGGIPPAEAEARHHAQIEHDAMAA